MMAVGASPPRFGNDDGRAGFFADDDACARFFIPLPEEACFRALPPGVFLPQGCCSLEGTITVTAGEPSAEDAKTLLARRLGDALTRSGEKSIARRVRLADDDVSLGTTA